MVPENGFVAELLLARAFKRCDPTLKVQFFFDGIQVVERLHRNSQAPRVLLLHVEMPGMDGVQALKTLRAEGYLYETTVIMFSSLTDADVVKEAYAAGARFYLTKPAGGDQYRDVAKLCVLCVHEQSGVREAASANSAVTVSRALDLLTPDHLVK